MKLRKKVKWLKTKDIEEIIYENNMAILVLYREISELKSKIKTQEKV